MQADKLTYSMCPITYSWHVNKLHVSYMWNLPKSPLFVLLVSAFLKYHPGLRTVMSSCALETRTEKNPFEY